MEKILIKSTMMILAGGSLLTMTACFDPTSNDDKPAPPTLMSETDSDFIGLSVEAATELAKHRKLPSRVIKIDDQWLAVTKDYRPKRVNFIVREGLVEELQKG